MLLDSLLKMIFEMKKVHLYNLSNINGEKKEEYYLNTFICKLIQYNESYINTNTNEIQQRYNYF